MRDLSVVDGSTLHIAEVRDRDQSEWIISPIPVNMWREAFRLEVNLSGREGTLAKALEQLADTGVNILASTVSPVSADGETSWVSVVELPEKVDPDVVEEELRAFLVAIGGLSKKPEFRENLDIMGLSLSRLATLASLAAVVHERTYRGTISDFALPLHECREAEGDSILLPITRYLNNHPSNVPPFCLLTVDSDEKYARLTFPSPRVKLFDLEMLVEIASDRGDFRGVFGNVVRAIGNSEINLFSCENNIIEKRGKSESERALFRFSADLSNYSGLDEDRERETESKLFRLIDGSTRSLGAQKVSIDRKHFRLAKREIFRPRCFLATNASAEDDAHRGLICALLRLLRRYGIDALNVDVAKSRRVRTDAELLLRSCPFLISVHLPSRSCRVAEEARDLSLGEPDGYSPSDWVMFEEAFMASQKREVFRFLHDEVRMPRYAFGEAPWRFADLASLEEQLARFESAVLSDFLNSSQYRKSFEDSFEFMKDRDLRFLNRDLVTVHDCFANA